MKTIRIRDIRAPLLREYATRGTPVSITDNRVLAGIFCPITRDWLAHTLIRNRSRIEQSLQQGEKNLADLDNMPTLDSLSDETRELISSSGWNPIELLQDVISAFMPALPCSGKGEAQGEPQHRTVPIGDLSAAVIREAARNQQTLAVTDRRELIGIIIPVSDQFVAHVVENNLSRIRRNSIQGERELQNSTELPTLDEVEGSLAQPLAR
ncbi:hypothetical protein ABZ540_35080 [Nocardia xishanensis]|uniref:hypothetical protein n=1 Tax=Nocardia xishanensis TaxID=238964 RepID=UPI00340F2AB9